MLKQLPKAELHSHLGGVLSSAEIIETALVETDFHCEDAAFITQVKDAIKTKDIDMLKNIQDRIFAYKNTGNNDDFKRFYAQLLTFIRAFHQHEALFDELLFGTYRNPAEFHAIGLIEYQKLGEFQGSALLQTKKTIAKALEIYVRKLRADSVHYVEIR